MSGTTGAQTKYETLELAYKALQLRRQVLLLRVAVVLFMGARCCSWRQYIAVYGSSALIHQQATLPFAVTPLPSMGAVLTYKEAVAGGGGSELSAPPTGASS